MNETATSSNSSSDSSSGPSPASSPGLHDLLRSLGSRRLLTILLLGFSSGLPYMLMASSLKIWLRREGIEIDTIGYLSMVMVPYSLNFLWAPLLDRFTPTRLGRRRSWILIAQLGLMLSLAGLGFLQPAASLGAVAMLAMSVSFFSATQDIGIDAYRREILRDEEQGLGASFVVYGYRLGMLFSSGFGLWLVDPETVGLSFQQMWWLMAAAVLVGMVTALLAREPDINTATPTTFHQAVIEPFVEFLSRPGALALLAFVLFFKLGDSMVASIIGPFYVDVGFSDGQIAEAANTVGFFSTLVGLFLGGVIIHRLGVLRALFLFAWLQALSTALFSLLTVTGPSWTTLAAIVAFEDVTSGAGTAALVAFITLLADRRFTATQYALLSSLATLGRTLLAGFAGEIVQAVGYVGLFAFGCLVALPGIALLILIMKRGYFQASTTAEPRDS